MAEAHPSQWYALRIRGLFARSILRALERFGIEAFLPETVQVVRWSDRLKRTKRPLFPGYLFVRAVPGQLAIALQVRGILSALPNNLSPLPIHHDEIRALRVMTAASGAQECTYEPVPAYGHGEAVEIVSGPLAGQRGTVQRTKAGYRLVVSIDAMQRACSVEIDARDLQKAA